jgi:hypothetical protein
LLKKLLPSRIKQSAKHGAEDLYFKWAKYRISQRFSSRDRRSDGPTILFASWSPGHSLNLGVTGHVECLLAKYLQLVHGGRPIFYLESPAQVNYNLFAAFGFEEFLFSTGSTDVSLPTDLQQLVDKLDIRGLNQYELNGIPIGRLAIAEARWLVRKSALETETDKATLERLLRKAVVLEEEVNQTIDTVRPDVVVANHTTYIQKGFWFHTTLKRNIRTVAWQVIDPQHIVVRHFRLAERMEHTSGVSVDTWEQLKQSDDVDQYRKMGQDALDKRRAGITHLLPNQPRLGLKFQPLPPKITFPEEKPIIGVFTHLPWDASGSYYEDLFPCLRDWIEFTARIAVENTQANWIFRIHPSEAHRGSKEDTAALIRNQVPASATHIQIIDGSVPISSYALASQLTAGVTVRGTLSVEMPSLGIPFICAGSGHTSVAGFNLFSESISAYEEQLRNAHTLQPLPQSSIDEALLFAYARLVHNNRHITCVDDLNSLRSMQQVTPEALIQDKGLQECVAILLPQT